MSPSREHQPTYDRDRLLSELTFEAVRSSGPGGQAVNKKSTKVRLHWRPAELSVFPMEAHQRLMASLAPRLTKSGELTLVSDQFRARPQNQRFVTELFFALIDAAIAIPEERIATKPTRASRHRRVEEKKRQGIKKARRKGEWE